MANINEEILRDALKVFGLNSQMLQTAEECAELSHAIIRLFNGRGKFEAVFEELADVYIMIQQMMLALDVDGEISAFAAKKMERLAGTIAEAKNSGDKNEHREKS